MSQVSGPVPGVSSRPGVEAVSPLVEYLLGAASAVAALLAVVVHTLDKRLEEERREREKERP